METMGLLGFVFGLSGLSFSLTAMGQVSSLKSEFEEFKKNMPGSDTSKNQPGSEDK